MGIQATSPQTGLFRGIYEFEDPSGTLLATRFPQHGSADLYSGTAIVVRPNQTAMLVYTGQIAEILHAGTHTIATDNFPILTRLANWKFGFTSPLRCEIWFFSNQLFTARRWGTTQPILFPLAGAGTVPLRVFGTYTLQVKDPGWLYLKLIGSRSSFDITEVDDWIQAQVQECLPEALSPIKEFKDLSLRQGEAGKRLLSLLFSRLTKMGLEPSNVQVLSILPPQEVLQALDEKLAIQVIGDERSYLLYKAANGLDALHKQGGDPLQMMMGLMLGKGLLGTSQGVPVGTPAATPGGLPSPAAGNRFCTACGQPNAVSSKFCSQCGKGLVS
jgi:membrane protease subunit (stomatin/prohibitin family)